MCVGEPHGQHCFATSALILNFNHKNSCRDFNRTEPECDLRFHDVFFFEQVGESPLHVILMVFPASKELMTTLLSALPRFPSLVNAPIQRLPAVCGEAKL